MSASAAESLGAEKYVRLTTFRKSGVGVGTAVWIVPGDGGRLLVVTSSDTGKVKRLRNGARVTLTPCDQRGRVADGVAEVDGTAVLFTDAARVADLHRRLVAKYGLLARVMQLVGKVRRRAESLGIEITLA